MKNMIAAYLFKILKMKKKSVVILILLYAGMSLKAQQDAMFTHYMYNTLWLNPAYAGTRDAFTITGIHRSQWSGYDGAPSDQTITMHSPFLNGKMGAGLSLLNDRIGPVKNTVIALDLDYQVKLTKKSRLSFGLKGMFSMYNSDLSALRLDNPDDVIFKENIHRSSFNTGSGIYYYSGRFYAGISSPKLLQNSLAASAGVMKEQRHYFFIAGTVIDLGENVKLKPTCFIKITAYAPVQSDITASFLFREKVSLGAMYRTGDAAGVLAGYNFTEQFAIGYSFDWSYSKSLSRYNGISHEIMLRYDLVSKNKSKIKSPRYF